MSRCTNSAMASIFCNCAVFPAAKVLTSCFIGSDAPVCPLYRFPSQLPMLCQLAKSFFRDVPPAGKNDTIIWPATPLHGGMSGSCLIPFTSLTTHCDRLPLPSVGFTSGCASHEALYSQPGGSCNEKWLSRTGSVSWKLQVSCNQKGCSSTSYS